MFRIPQLEMEGDYAAQINAEILKQYGVEAMQNGEPVGYASADYTWADNGAILSLSVVGVPEEYYDNICVVCNIDINTGEEVSYDAVYGSLGLTGEEYRALVKKALLNRLVLTSEDAFGESAMNYDFTEIIEKTENDANIRSATTYLDSEGKLWIRGTVYQFAGAESNEYLLPLTDYELSPNYYNYFQE